MDISGDEALSLLRKWGQERIPVKGLAVSGDSVVASTVTGFINGLSPDILISSNGDANSILFRADQVVNFSYTEAKDLPVSDSEKQRLAAKHGMASLSIKLQNGARISIFEI